MEMTSTTAELVSADDLNAELAAISATVSRAEVEEALGSAERPELFLELMREGDERHELSVSWDRDDLERLLGQSEGDAIRLMFRQEDLEQAIDDVELHGLRDRMLVLTVAAATAATAASATSNAAAALDVGGATGVQPVVTSVHDEAGLATRGIETTSTNDEATLSQRGIESEAVSVAHDEATLSQRGIESEAVAVAHDEAGLAARGIAQPGTHDEVSLAARGIDPAPAMHDEATLVDRGIVQPVAAVHDETSLTARGIESQPTPGDDGGIAIDLPTMDAGTAAVVGGAAGGIALLITAAAFSRRRPAAPRPT